MMNKKQFIESQKECATMLGMSLDEYQEYCKSLKVPEQKNDDNEENNTNKVLEFFGTDKNILKIRKDY